MERELLTSLVKKTQAMGLADPVDARGFLPINPLGRKFKTRVVEQIKGLVVHQELGWGSIESVARYHTGPDSHVCKGGTESILYTLAIDRDGRLYLCNDISKATWSHGDKARPGDENVEFMSVMLVGDLKAEGYVSAKAGEPNFEQISTLLGLWQACRDLWGWDDSCLHGHFDFGKLACPGNTLKQLILAIRSNTKPSIDLSTTKGVQLALKFLGHYKGAIDGLWGKGSAMALKSFQASSGLGDDGVWEPNTEAAIKIKLKEAKAC